MDRKTQPALDPAVDPLIASAQEAIVAATGSSLVGLYVLGSLASGGFDAAVSDVDLLAVLAHPPGDALIGRLRRMHADLARAHPAWDDRVEVVYISARGLADCRTATTGIAVISQGQPFGVAQAGPDWVLNWYPARADGLRLVGPPIGELIPPIPHAEYIDQVRRSLARLTRRVPDDATPGWQAYVILTMCRGLHTVRSGELLSKDAAAAWAQRELPQWADLVRRALGWRRHQHGPDGPDGTATVPETRAFVDDMAQLARGGGRAAEG